MMMIQYCNPSEGFRETLIIIIYAYKLKAERSICQNPIKAFIYGRFVFFLWYSVSNALISSGPEMPKSLECVARGQTNALVEIQILRLLPISKLPLGAAG